MNKLLLGKALAFGVSALVADESFGINQQHLPPKLRHKPKVLQNLPPSTHQASQTIQQTNCSQNASGTQTQNYPTEIYGITLNPNDSDFEYFDDEFFEYM